MSSPSEDQKERHPEREGDISRRDFLKVAMMVSGLMAFGGVATVLKAISNPAPGTVSARTFPRVKVADASIAVNSPVYFDYPLVGEPNFLVNLGQPVAGGVGPKKNIVAFSQLCQHAGCPSISYQAVGLSGGPCANCSCHGSIFDLLLSAKPIAGPAKIIGRPQPQVLLEADSSGNIFAKGMGPPTIFGHNTGSNDVSADLQGGNVVG